MFENSQDSVVYKTLGQPIIKGSSQLLRVQHFDSQVQGLMRSTVFNPKHRKDIEERIKHKMKCQNEKCLQILSYEMMEQGEKKCTLRLWLHPGVKAALFSRLRRQIEGEFYCQEGVLRGYTGQLVETIARLESQNQYRDINLWNVFEDGFENVLVGDLSEVAEKVPTSRFYGCFIDYISVDRRSQKPIQPAKEMAWGLGIILLGLSVNQLPKCLNFRDQETKMKLGFMMEGVKMRHGWDLYEVVRELFQGTTCKKLKQLACFNRWINNTDGRMTLLFQNAQNCKIPQSCTQLTLFQCQPVTSLPAAPTLLSLTIKFTAIQHPNSLLPSFPHLHSLHLIQSPTPLCKLLPLLPSFALSSLSLVNLDLRQTHLKYLLKLGLKLEHLDLSMNRELGDLGFKMVVESEMGKRVRTLRMGGPDSGCRLGNKTIAVLLEKVGNLQELEMLDLSWNDIDDQGYKLLRMGFEKVSHIVKIDLTRTRIECQEPLLLNVLL